MNITTDLVKELRDQTGVSIMQCRKALEEAEGDMEKALAILKKSSSDIALKKKDRIANDGSVDIKTNGKKAVLVALHCETDFVSKNEDFITLLDKLTQTAFNEGAEYVKNNSKEIIEPIIQKTGENIQLGDIFEVNGENIGSYVHNKKKAVLVNLKGGSEEIAKDIAMHFAAMRPEYIDENEINEENKKIMKDIFLKEIEAVDKPEEIKNKMLEGKINTYFKEKTLLNQTFIKNNDKTIKEVLKDANAEIVEIKSYFI